MNSENKSTYSFSVSDSFENISKSLHSLKQYTLNKVITEVFVKCSKGRELKLYPLDIDEIENLFKEGILIVRIAEFRNDEDYESISSTSSDETGYDSDDES